MTPPPTGGYRFATGDAVAHATRPEWGVGRVRQAQWTEQGGRQTQRLIVDFPHRGRVTLDASVAPLRPTDPPTPRHDAATEPDFLAKRNPSMSTSGFALSNNTGGWLAELESRANGGKQSHELWDLPEELSDPFLSDEARLKATLETYRYSTEPRSLIEWAQRQTGLEDPLTKYTRTDMEQAFPRFARDRDNHLKDLVRQLKRAGRQNMVEQVRNKCQIPAAVSAVDKALRA